MASIIDMGFSEPFKGRRRAIFRERKKVKNVLKLRGEINSCNLPFH